MRPRKELRSHGRAFLFFSFPSPSLVFCFYPEAVGRALPRRPDLFGASSSGIRTGFVSRIATWIRVPRQRTPYLLTCGDDASPSPSVLGIVDIATCRLATQSNAKAKLSFSVVT